MIAGRKCHDELLWDEVIHDMDGHPLQLWGWGELKAVHGWSAHRVLFTDDEDRVVGAAQIVTKRLPAPLTRFNYVPRGPVWHDGSEAEVLDALAAYARRYLPGIVLTIEPDDTEMPAVHGWRESTNTVLSPHTLVLDLERGERSLLEAMDAKTREYIQESGEKNLVVRRVKKPEDIGKCIGIYKQAATRTGTRLRDDLYYQDVHALMGDSSVIFAAYSEEGMVAFLWLVVSKKTAFRLYSGTSDDGHRLKARYMLEWHAITKCKQWGIDRYDMNGIDGEAHASQGFASHSDELVGTYDYPLSKLYPLWVRALPVVKSLLRKSKLLRK